MITTFTFQVRNIPAPFTRRWGVRDERGEHDEAGSYMVGGSFTATEFYADIEGHPEDPPVARALEELDYFSKKVTILGVYPSDRQRG